MAEIVVNIPTDKAELVFRNLKDIRQLFGVAIFLEYDNNNCLGAQPQCQNEASDNRSTSTYCQDEQLTVNSLVSKENILVPITSKIKDFKCSEIPQQYCSTLNIEKSLVEQRQTNESELCVRLQVLHDPMCHCHCQAEGAEGKFYHSENKSADLKHFTSESSDESCQLKGNEIRCSPCNCDERLKKAKVCETIF